MGMNWGRGFSAVNPLFIHQVISPLFSEPDGGARARGEVAGGVSVDDGDLDPAAAAGQGDEGARGVVGVGAAEARDAGAGDGREEIMAEHLRVATRALGKLLGRVDVEDILDVIFRDFCIGK